MRHLHEMLWDLTSAQLAHDSEWERRIRQEMADLEAAQRVQIRASFGTANPDALVAAANAEYSSKVLELVAAFPETDDTRRLADLARCTRDWYKRAEGGIWGDAFAEMKVLAARVAADLKASVTRDVAEMAGSMK